jgi:cyanate lyase
MSNNQESFRSHFLQEYMEKQDELSNKLVSCFSQMIDRVEETKVKQDVQFHQLVEMLQEQEVNVMERVMVAIKEQETTLGEVMQQLDQLEENGQMLHDTQVKEKLMSEAILDQLAFQDDALRKLSSQLEMYESGAKEVFSQFDKQGAINEQIAQSFQTQEVFHQTVMERLDQQEATTEKVSRQLDNLKGILYERAAHIVEKLETNLLKITQPVHRFFISREEKQEK